MIGKGSFSAFSTKAMKLTFIFPGTFGIKHFKYWKKKASLFKSVCKSCIYLFFSGRTIAAFLS